MELDSAHVRRPRNRAATQEALLASARHLLERDGVLTGVSLREVADDAGVNRGQIYQYFGSRRDLLRAALASMSKQRAQEGRAQFNTPFRVRRRRAFEKALSRRAEVRLEALLAIDGETQLGLFPILEEALAASRRDVETGELPPDSDVELLHVMTASTYLGYAIFREAFADETGISLADLDERARAVYDRMLDALAAGPVNPAKNAATTADG